MLQRNDLYSFDLQQRVGKILYAELVHLFDVKEEGNNRGRFD